MRWAGSGDAASPVDLLREAEDLEGVRRVSERPEAKNLAGTELHHPACFRVAGHAAALAAVDHSPDAHHEVAGIERLVRSRVDALPRLAEVAYVAAQAVVPSVPAGGQQGGEEREPLDL